MVNKPSVFEKPQFYCIGKDEKWAETSPYILHIKNKLFHYRTIMIKILCVIIFVFFMVTSICIVDWDNYILYPPQYSVMEASFFKSGIIAFIMEVGEGGG